MTLIPLISALAASPSTASAPAGAAALLPRETYGSGTGHRPVAALLALGLPAALVVAVALSPMIIEAAPTPMPTPWKSFKLPPPPPPPEPTAKETATPKTASANETTVPPIETTFNDNAVEPGPSIPDVIRAEPGPTVVPDPPAPPPKLVLAELDPKFAGLFQPDYPASEQRRELEGVAKVRVLIGTDGRVKAVELVSTDSQGFFEETKRRALSKWRFKPATRGGVAEESWKVMTVRFQIRNG